MSEKTCCVTGHREISEEQVESVKESLRCEIEKAIAEGYTCFISGFAKGVDQYFAGIVAEKKQSKSAFGSRNSLQKAVGKFAKEGRVKDALGCLFRGGGDPGELSAERLFLSKSLYGGTL